MNVAKSTTQNIEIFNIVIRICYTNKKSVGPFWRRFYHPYDAGGGGGGFQTICAKLSLF